MEIDGKEARRGSPLRPRLPREILEPHSSIADDLPIKLSVAAKLLGYEVATFRTYVSNPAKRKALLLDKLFFKVGSLNMTTRRRIREWSQALAEKYDRRNGDMSDEDVGDVILYDVPPDLVRDEAADKEAVEVRSGSGKKEEE